MKNIGYNPSWILYSPQFYGPQAVQAAKATPVVPAELRAVRCVALRARQPVPGSPADREHREVRCLEPQADGLHLSAFSAWTLWAAVSHRVRQRPHAGSACSHKAQSHSDWTAGGLYPPHSTGAGCAGLAVHRDLVQLTPTGFVYNRRRSPDPTDGPFNCDPANVRTVKTYETS